MSTRTTVRSTIDQPGITHLIRVEHCQDGNVRAWFWGHDTWILASTTIGPDADSDAHAYDRALESSRDYQFWQRRETRLRSYDP